MTAQHDADQREFETWWRKDTPACRGFALDAWHASRAALRAQQREATDIDPRAVWSAMQVVALNSDTRDIAGNVQTFYAELARLGLRVVQGAKPLGGGE
jgi:hypothetical protein